MEGVFVKLITRVKARSLFHCSFKDFRFAEGRSQTLVTRLEKLDSKTNQLNVRTAKGLEDVSEALLKVPALIKEVS